MYSVCSSVSVSELKRAQTMDIQYVCSRYSEGGKQQLQREKKSNVFETNRIGCPSAANTKNTI